MHQSILFKVCRTTIEFNVAFELRTHFRFKLAQVINNPERIVRRPECHVNMCQPIPAMGRHGLKIRRLFQRMSGLPQPALPNQCQPKSIPGLVHFWTMRDGIFESRTSLVISAFLLKHISQIKPGCSQLHRRTCHSGELLKRQNRFIQPLQLHQHMGAAGKRVTVQRKKFQNTLEPCQCLGVLAKRQQCHRLRF